MVDDVERLKELLEAAAKLVTALGPFWTIVVVLLFVGYHEFREWQKGRRERSIADEKEAQIQRLADDNRWMRRVLMVKVMGFSEAEAEKLMGEGQPTPLLSERKEKKEGPP